MSGESTVGELITTLIDYRGKTPRKTSSGVPLITAKVIKDGVIRARPREYIAEDNYDAWMRRGWPQSGDILITTEAPLGEVARVGDDSRIALAQRVILLRPDAGRVDPSFMFHYLRSPQAQAGLRRRSSGTTVSGIRQPELRALEVPLIDRPGQVVVGAILDSIDDLLENNRRRVEVLEEMARAIYREWFVKFRYPGHGDVPLVDSALGPIPEGWETRRVREVSDVVRGRSYRSAELVEEGGLPFVNLKCMARGGGFRRDGLKRYIGTYTLGQLVSEGDIVLAVTDLTQGREILARATRVPRLDEGHGVISLDVVRVVPNGDAERLWIFAALGWSDFPDRVKEYANGSTVLHLSPKYLEEAELLWVPEPARKRFTAVIAPMLAQIAELSEQTRALRGLRDLLLPNLVTGQIDVSSLDPDTLVSTGSTSESVVA